MAEQAAPSRRRLLSHVKGYQILASCPNLRAMKHWGKAFGALLGVVVAGVGVAIAFSRMRGWSACLAVVPLRDGTDYPQACYDEMGVSHNDLLPFWGMALLLVTASILVQARRPNRVAISALAVAVLAVPLLDFGFVWQGWNTADAVPGFGVTSSVLSAIAGLLATTSALVGRSNRKESLVAVAPAAATA